MNINLINVELRYFMEMGIFLTNRWLYFSDWGTHPKIERIGMDGNLNSRTTIVKDNIQWPNGLCLDYANEKVYWIDAKLKSIFAAELDGSNVKRILHNAEQILHPFSLTIFEVIFIFFWVLMLLFFCHLEHYSSQYDIVFIFIFFPLQDYVYWTDWSSEAIRKVHKFTGEEYTQLALGLRSPMDIKVYHEQRQLHSKQTC